MPIAANINSNYNPRGAVNEKYTPFAPATLTVTPAAAAPFLPEITQLIGGRQALFRELTGTAVPAAAGTPYNVTIKFYGRNITNTYAQEALKVAPGPIGAGQSVPPLAILSSNRSAWILQQFNLGAAWIAVPNPAPTGIIDNGILAAGTIPIYAPYRIGQVGGQNRGVYIFVHMSEYDTYFRNLNGTGMEVIGWDFPDAPMADVDFDYFPWPSMFGFGISRYVIIEFFKSLYAQGLAAGVNNVCDKIWMMDDNIMYLNGQRNLPFFEALLPGAVPVVGLGFPGDNAPAVAYAAPAAVPVASNWNPDTNPMLIQQMMLWNVAHMNQYNYDFSPYFITAGEDLSFTQYNLKYLVQSCQCGQADRRRVRGFKIIKAQVPAASYDNTAAYQRLSANKDGKLTELNAVEVATVINNRVATTFGALLNTLPTVVVTSAATTAAAAAAVAAATPITAAAAAAVGTAAAAVGATLATVTAAATAAGVPAAVCNAVCVAAIAAAATAAANVASEPAYKTSCKAVEQTLRTGIRQDGTPVPVAALPPYDDMFNITATVQLQNV